MACCGCLPIAEDNARFLLLALVLLCYMIAGAFIFQYLESEVESGKVDNFRRLYHEFCDTYLPDHHKNTTQSHNEVLEKLHNLLYAFGNVTTNVNRRRWDFASSFHFVGTIVSTIGYGSTTPQTTLGQVTVIIYGFLGCSSGILFFNLFLERIITFLAWILRTLHLRKFKKRLKATALSIRRMSRISRTSLPDIIDDEEEISLEHWKPSVYWVMLSLTLASCCIASVAAAVYSPNENWTYFEALYFCFVSFSTIGFGDYVPLQKDSYPNIYSYSVANFLFIVLGCCCSYSLLNVTSIVIKQMLNWVIVQSQCRCKDDPRSSSGKFIRRHSIYQNSRKKRRKSSAAYPQNSRKIRRHNMVQSWRKEKQNGTPCEEDSDSAVYDSDGERRLSGELISMKDFFKANKVSLAVMQKQLYETAQMQRNEWSDCEATHRCGGIHVIPNRRLGASSFTPGTVGPLAIVSEKLGDSTPAR